MLDESAKQRARIEKEVQLGDISHEEAAAELGSLVEVLEDAQARVLSGEWDRSGVKDDDWATYQETQRSAYSRSCAAAYELAG